LNKCEVPTIGKEETFNEGFAERWGELHGGASWCGVESFIERSLAAWALQHGATKTNNTSQRFTTSDSGGCEDAGGKRKWKCKRKKKLKFRKKKK